MMEHYDRIRPGSKIAWLKCDCKPESKIDRRIHSVIKSWLQTPQMFNGRMSPASFGACNQQSAE